MTSRVARASLLIAGVVACTGEFELERRGGPFPAAPVEDPAGGGGNSGESPEAGQGGRAEVPITFCAAIAVVREKCQRCHGEPLRNNAPVPFLQHEDFHVQYGRSTLQYWEVAADVVSKDIMPYVALNDAQVPPMPPVEPLTSDEKATLLAWLERGALPEGGTDCPDVNAE